jgi:serine phosphatase RsbU (regulator of sigma subunit)/Tfp pilus assembly protein PilF
MQKAYSTYIKSIAGLLGMLLLLCSSHLLAEQNPKTDSLLTLIKKDKPDTNKVNHLNELGGLLMSINTDSAIVVYNEAINTLESQSKKIKSGIGAISILALTYSNLAKCYYLKSDYTKAQELYYKALNLNKSTKNQKEIAKNLLNLGNVYNSIGEYNEAFDNYREAISIQEKIGDKNTLSVTLGNMGTMYTIQKNHEKALDYFSQSMALAKEIGNKNQTARVLRKIGLVYQKQKKFQKAFDAFFSTLTLVDTLDNKLLETHDKKLLIGLVLVDIGQTYYDQGDSVKSLDYYLKALHIFEQQGNESQIAISLKNTGQNYIKLKKYKLAFDYIYRALAIDQKIGSKYGIQSDYYSLSELYKKSTTPLPDTIGEKTLNIEEMRLRSLHYLKRAEAIKNELFSEEKQRKFFKKSKNNELEKEQEITHVKREKELAISAEKSQTQKTISFAVSVLLIGLFFISIFIFRSLKTTSKQKEIIEQKNKETELHKHIIEEKNKDITASINYAKRIQNALLREEEHVTKHLPEHFILFLPKDIVSGDFYWGAEKNEYWYFTAADCTGHGVPGAIMSMLGVSFLNDIVLSEQTLTPAEILNQLRDRIITELRQADATVGNKDGMDISLCRLNLKTLELQWAGANNALTVIRKGVLEEIKADKQPIGYHTEMKPFTNHQIQLQKGDCIYVYSDGYADQFGGPKGKKLKYKQLKELIIEYHQLSSTEQKQIFKNRFMEWKGTIEQVDDVCLFGVRV